MVSHRKCEDSRCGVAAPEVVAVFSNVSFSGAKKNWARKQRSCNKWTMSKRSREEWQVLHVRDLVMTGYDFNWNHPLVLRCTIKPWSTFCALTARLGGKETSVQCSTEWRAVTLHSDTMTEEEGQSLGHDHLFYVRLLQKANRQGLYRKSNLSRRGYPGLGTWAARQAY